MRNKYEECESALKSLKVFTQQSSLIQSAICFLSCYAILSMWKHVGVVDVSFVVYSSLRKFSLDLTLF